MSAVTDLLDDLAEGRTTLGKVTDAFRALNWSSSNDDADITEDDGVVPAPNSFDEVQTDSRLTVRQYAQLAAAYREAVGGQGG